MERKWKGDRKSSRREPDLCAKRRQKGEQELSQGELDPCLERGRTREESSGVVCREETDKEGKFEKMTFNTIVGI
jgi:hypothetical protein